MIAETSDVAALRDTNRIPNGDCGVVASGEALSQQSLALSASLVPATTLVTGFGNAWSVGGYAVANLQ
jgi:hypothetical protein